MRWTFIPFYSFLNAPNPDMSTQWKTIRPEETSLGAFHSYMLAAIGPRPIAFVSTIDADGRPNLAPYSFFNAFGYPPCLYRLSLPEIRLIEPNQTDLNSYEPMRAVFGEKINMESQGCP